VPAPSHSITHTHLLKHLIPGLSLKIGYGGFIMVVCNDIANG